MDVKRKAFALPGLFATLLFVLASCNPFLSLERPSLAEPTTSSVPAPGTGGIAFGVQAVSQVMLDTIEKMRLSGALSELTTRSVSPRMYLSAAKVVFTVTDSGGGTVDSWTIYPELYSPGYAGNQLGVRYLPPGEYTLRADVFNNPSDTTRSVGGSQPFSVVTGQEPGENMIWVTCFPESPTNLPDEGTDYGPYTLSIPWEANYNNQLQVIGSEQWFTTTPTSGLTSFTVSQADGSSAQPVIFLFNGNGEFLGQAWPDGTGAPVGLPLCPTDYGTTYYVGVVDFAWSGSASRAFTVRYADSLDQMPVPTALDSNLNTWFVDSISRNQTKTYSFTASAGQSYVINWDNYSMGSGSYEMNVRVAAFDGVMSLLFGPDENGWIGSDYYSYGWYNEWSTDNGQYLTVDTDQTITILVREEYSEPTTGNFALKISTESPPVIESINVVPSPGTVGSPISLSASVTDPDPGQELSYRWELTATPGPMIPIANADQPTASFVPDASGSYTVQLTVTDPFGERTTLSSQVSVDPDTSGQGQIDYGIF